MDNCPATKIIKHLAKFLETPPPNPLPATGRGEDYDSMSVNS